MYWLPHLLTLCYSNNLQIAIYPYYAHYPKLHHYSNSKRHFFVK